MTNSLAVSQPGISRTDIENLLCMLQRCVPNFESIVHLSLDPQGDIEKTWEEWCETVARHIFVPLMQKVHAHAIAGHVREIVELDKSLALENLPSMPKLCIEGRRLISSHLPPKCERTLQRYCTQVQNKESPACFPVVHALRGAVFHIPLPMVVESYIYLEALLVANRQTGIRPEMLLEKFLRSPAHVEKLRAA